MQNCSGTSCFSMEVPRQASGHYIGDRSFVFSFRLSESRITPKPVESLRKHYSEQPLFHRQGINSLSVLYAAFSRVSIPTIYTFRYTGKVLDTFTTWVAENRPRDSFDVVCTRFCKAYNRKFLPQPRISYEEVLNYILKMPVEKKKAIPPNMTVPLN